MTFDELRKWAEAKGYTPLHTFTIARVGWEMDNRGLVVDTAEGPKLILTSHGSPRIADNFDVARYIDELKGWLKSARKAAELLDIA